MATVKPHTRRVASGKIVRVKSHNRVPKQKVTKMSDYTATGLAEGFIEGTRKKQIEAWQHLVDTGLAWKLQGWFGRVANNLIDDGIIKGRKMKRF